MNEKTYKIYFTKPSKIKKEDLKIEIYIKLTPEEKELMDRQQLQVNSQKFLEWEETCVESYCLTIMIEHYIKPSNKKFDWKILVNHADEADRIVLENYVKQLLDITWKYLEKNILTK